MDDHQNVSNPNETDDTNNKILRDTIEKWQCFDSEISWKHRIEVLSKLQEIAAQMGTVIKILYRVRVNAHFPGLDIDGVCFAPRTIDDNFFEQQFPDELQKHSKFEGFRIIGDNYGPKIEISFDGIKVRLAFGRVTLDNIPERIQSILWSLERNSVWLKYYYFDTPSYSVTDANCKVYSLALRAVKLWAKQRGFYSPSKRLFLYTDWESSVSVSFSATNKDCSLTVGKFFTFFLLLRWPSASERRKSKFNFYPYSPDNIHLRDRNGQEITNRYVLHELKRTARLINEISRGSTTWDTLFYEPNFFYEYVNFLVLLEWSPSKETHLKWRERIASKLHHLIDYFDNNKRIELLHVNPNHFERQRLSRIDRQFDAKPFCTMWFIAIEKKSQMAGYEHLIGKDVKNFEKMLIRSRLARDAFVKDEIEIEVRRITRNRLRFYLSKSYLDSLRKRLESQLPWSVETLTDCSTEFDVDERLYLSNLHIPLTTSETSPS